MRFKVYRGAPGATALSLAGAGLTLIGVILLISGLFGDAGSVGEWLPASLICAGLGVFLTFRAEKVAEKTIEKKKKKQEENFLKQAGQDRKF